jgi:ADP-heptose:LPS heptosyltransferase
MPSEPKKILFIGYAAIGDLIFLLPVLETLRSKFPKAEITFLANPYPTTEELLPATKLADHVWRHDWDGPEGSARQREINKKIVSARFDWAILSAAAPAHYFREGLAQIPVKAGHRRPLEGWPWQRLKRWLVTGEFARAALLTHPAEMKEPHALRRNLALLTALGLDAPKDPRPKLPISDEHRARVVELLGEKKGPRIGVHLGAPNNQYGKMWAPGRFGELMMSLAGRNPECRFVLIGSQEEKASADTAHAVFPAARSIVGRTNLLESFAAVETCDVFLSNDTGLAKAAMVLGVPTATFWGPSDPAEYGVVWDAEKHLDIRTGIECSPCSRLGMARPGRLNYLTCGHHACLTRLDVAFAEKKLAAKFPRLWP